MDFSGYQNLAVLSGVEPHRTILQERLTRRFLQSGERSLIVEGKPEREIRVVEKDNLTVVSHLPDPELFQALTTALTIYCRSGYSTIMDLAAIGISDAILIPTPGQTEQEYLAQHLASKGFRVLKQEEV